MKPIFCVDITTDKKNETINGSEFITRSSSAQKLSEYEEKQENFDQTIEQAKLPLWMRIVKYICGLFALIVLVGVFRACLEDDITFRQALMNAPFLIIGGCISGVIWVVTYILSVKKEKRVLEEQKVEEQAQAIDLNLQALYSELNVPIDATSVDVLAFRYKIQDDKIVPKSVGLQSTPYLNLDLQVFFDNDCLHLSDIAHVYSFPRTELKAIQTVKKRIAVPSWNKDEAPTKGRFKPYKMTVNNMDMVYFKPYHILVGEHDGETYGIYFPCYELDVFEGLTGLKAEN